MKTKMQKNPPNRNYPYLGITYKSDEPPICGGTFVVLFTSPGTGTVVHDPDDIHGVGTYLEHNWIEDNFEPYHGTITLSND